MSRASRQRKWPRSCAGQTFQYDTENRLTRVRNAANGANILRVLYDGDGQRILTVDSTGTKATLDKLYEKNLTTGDETLFVYAGSQLIATKKNGTVSTIHPDHLGGIALTIQGSTVVSDLAFYPFGEQRSTSTGTPTSDRRFNGESLIDSVGLYQMGARWYDPAIGRWTQADMVIPRFRGETQFASSLTVAFVEPARLAELQQDVAAAMNTDPGSGEEGQSHRLQLSVPIPSTGTPSPFAGESQLAAPITAQFLNRYAYAGNNPLGLTDPSGHGGEAVAGGFLLVAVACPECVAFIVVGGVVVRTAIIVVEYGEDIGSLFFAKESEEERNPAQDKLLSEKDIKKLEDAGYDVHELKGKKHASQRDLYKDRKGNVYVKPKGGKGAGEPVGVNLNDLP